MKKLLNTILLSTALINCQTAMATRIWTTVALDDDAASGSFFQKQMMNTIANSPSLSFSSNSNNNYHHGRFDPQQSMFGNNMFGYESNNQNTITLGFNDYILTLFNYVNELRINPIPAALGKIFPVAGKDINAKREPEFPKAEEAKVETVEDNERRARILTREEERFKTELEDKDPKKVFLVEGAGDYKEEITEESAVPKAAKKEQKDPVIGASRFSIMPESVAFNDPEVFAALMRREIPLERVLEVGLANKGVSAIYSTKSLMSASESEIKEVSRVLLRMMWNSNLNVGKYGFNYYNTSANRANYIDVDKSRFFFPSTCSNGESCFEYYLNKLLNIHGMTVLQDKTQYNENESPLVLATDSIFLSLIGEGNIIASGKEYSKMIKIREQIYRITKSRIYINAIHNYSPGEQARPRFELGQTSISTSAQRQLFTSRKKPSLKKKTILNLKTIPEDKEEDEKSELRSEPNSKLLEIIDTTKNVKEDVKEDTKKDEVKGSKNVVINIINEEESKTKKQNKLRDDVQYKPSTPTEQPPYSELLEAIRAEHPIVVEVYNKLQKIDAENKTKNAERYMKLVERYLEMAKQTPKIAQVYMELIERVPVLADIYLQLENKDTYAAATFLQMIEKSNYGIEKSNYVYERVKLLENDIQVNHVGSTGNNLSLAVLYLVISVVDTQMADDLLELIKLNQFMVERAIDEVFDIIRDASEEESAPASSKKESGTKGDEVKDKKIPGGIENIVSSIFGELFNNFFIDIDKLTSEIPQIKDYLTLVLATITDMVNNSYYMNEVPISPLALEQEVITLHGNNSRYSGTISIPQFAKKLYIYENSLAKIRRFNGISMGRRTQHYMFEDDLSDLTFYLLGNNKLDLKLFSPQLQMNFDNTTETRSSGNIEIIDTNAEHFKNNTLFFLGNYDKYYGKVKIPNSIKNVHLNSDMFTKIKHEDNINLSKLTYHLLDNVTVNLKYVKNSTFEMGLSSNGKTIKLIDTSNPTKIHKVIFSGNNKNYKESNDGNNNSGIVELTPYITEVEFINAPNSFVNLKAFNTTKTLLKNNVLSYETNKIKVIPSNYNGNIEYDNENNKDTIDNIWKYNKSGITWDTSTFEDCFVDGKDILDNFPVSIIHANLKGNKNIKIQTNDNVMVLLGNNNEYTGTMIIPEHVTDIYLKRISKIKNIVHKGDDKLHKLHFHYEEQKPERKDNNFCVPVSALGKEIHDKTPEHKEPHKKDPHKFNDHSKFEIDNKSFSIYDKFNKDNFNNYEEFGKNKRSEYKKHFYDFDVNFEKSNNHKNNFYDFDMNFEKPHSRKHNSNNFSKKQNESSKYEEMHKKYLENGFDTQDTPEILDNDKQNKYNDEHGISEEFKRREESHKHNKHFSKKKDRFNGREEAHKKYLEEE